MGLAVASGAGIIGAALGLGNYALMLAADRRAQDRFVLSIHKSLC